MLSEFCLILSFRAHGASCEEEPVFLNDNPLTASLSMPLNFVSTLTRGLINLLGREWSRFSLSPRKIVGMQNRWRAPDEGSLYVLQ